MIPGEKEYLLLPEHDREGMKGYIEEGRPTGSFLQACLENNLVEAVGRADKINAACLKNICIFLWNYVPYVARGSEEKVKAWIKRGGLRGRTSGSGSPDEEERRVSEGPN